MKLILGIGSSLEGRLLLYNGEEGTSRVLKLRKWSETCPLVEKKYSCLLTNDSGTRARLSDWMHESRISIQSYSLFLIHFQKILHVPI